MTLQCSSTLTQARGKLTGLYCNQRWCLTCARIRTAKLIAGYMPALNELEEKYFLTLTVPNVKGVVLKDTMTKMCKNASNIYRVLKTRRKIRFSALRKIECTYNQERNDYHPHFHIILSSKRAGQLFIEEWLKRYPDAKVDAQDLREADNNSCMELFKYFTKIISKSKATGDYNIQLKALDTIFRAMKGKRTFQPSGCIKEVSEEVEPDIAELAPDDLVACWSWLETDWIDKETGECLTGYEPSDAIRNIGTKVIVEKEESTTFGELLHSQDFNIPPTNVEPSTPLSKTS